MAGEHDPAHQARDLTVLEVQFLEECVAHEGLHVLDRFAAGVFLFQIYARNNRWSDIRFVRSFEWDFLQVQGQTEGYIEARSKDVKQSNRKKKQTLFMPLVAPVRGVHPTVVWGVAWKDVASKVGRRFDVAPLGPLLPAVDAEGKWLKRTVDSQEASAWWTQLLRKRDPSMERVTTHSLKHTPLGWLSKYGIYGETQTLLSPSKLLRIRPQGQKARTLQGCPASLGQFFQLAAWRSSAGLCLGAGSCECPGAPCHA